MKRTRFIFMLILSIILTMGLLQFITDLSMSSHTDDRYLQDPSRHDFEEHDYDDHEEYSLRPSEENGKRRPRIDEQRDTRDQQQQ